MNKILKLGAKYTFRSTEQAFRERVRKQWNITLYLGGEGLLLGNPALWLLAALPFTPCPSHCFIQNASSSCREGALISDRRWGDSMLFWD